jgi:hypothetical protein
MGVGIAGEQYLWPNRTIPCEIDALPNPHRVIDAIAHWNANSCIRFVAREGENDYVRIVRKAGAASSEVGRRGGEQLVSLGDSVPLGAIIHELGHTVGLWHEQCHSERDQWVQIDFTNIEDRLRWQFELNNIGGTVTPTIDLSPYDYGSIMHYPEPSFPIDPAVPVMTALQPPGAVFGQREGLSPGDLAAVAKLYENVPEPADDNRTAPTVRPAPAAPQPAAATPRRPAPVTAAPPARPPAAATLPGRIRAVLATIRGRLWKPPTAGGRG